MKKILFLVGACCGLWMVISLVFAQSIPQHATPILTIPPYGKQGLPYSEVSFRWKYHEDPHISSEIEKQVEQIGLRVARVSSRDNYRPIEYLGECGIYFPPGEAMDYKTKFEPRTYASTNDCGGGQLKPGAWYRWSVRAYFKDGTKLLKTSAFQTMDWVDQNGYRETVYLDVDIGINPRIMGVTRNGQSHTIKSIYRTAGFDLAISEREMPKFANIGEPPTLLEIANFFRQQPHEYYLSKGTDWYIPITLLKSQQGRTMNFFCSWNSCQKYAGYTFKPEKKKEENGMVYKYFPTAIVLISDNIKESLISANAYRLGMTENQCYLHTLAHELGHGIGMGSKGHSFGDEQGMTIMNDMAHLNSTKWDYVWSAKSLDHFYLKPLEELKPIQRN